MAKKAHGGGDCVIYGGIMFMRRQWKKVGLALLSLLAQRWHPAERSVADVWRSGIADRLDFQNRVFTFLAFVRQQFTGDYSWR